MAYLRLMRLPDQYLVIGAGLALGIYLKTVEMWVLVWTLALIFLSIAAMLVNEITDGRDTDKLSWNPIHVKRSSYDPTTVYILIVMFSLIGLFLSWTLGFIWWAVLCLSLAIFYSLEPVRFKKHAVVDLISQIAAGWIIPIAGPLWNYGELNNAWLSIVSVSLLSTAAFLPYQLADFETDTQSGIRGTHVLLGVKGTIWLIISLSVLGILLYFLSGAWQRMLWAAAFIPVNLYIIFKRSEWLSDSYSVLRPKLIRYVKLVKPATQLFILVMLLMWVSNW